MRFQMQCLQVHLQARVRIGEGTCIIKCNAYKCIYERGYGLKKGYMCSRMQSLQMRARPGPGKDRRRGFAFPYAVLTNVNASQGKDWGRGHALQNTIIANEIAS
jgi:hypothetical protein